MKVQSAIIKLILWTSKTLSNGENPIMLQVSFNGTKRVSTHFSCVPKYWDKKNECIKKGYPNYNGINESITNLKNELIKKKLEFERTETPYNAELLISTQETKSTPLAYYDVMQKMFLDKASRYNTKKSHTFVYEKLKNHFGRNNFLVSELTNEKLIEIANSWSDLSANTLVTYTRTIRAIIQFSVDNGYITNFPNKGFAYIKSHFRNEIKHKSLKELDMMRIQGYVEEQLNNNIDKLLSKGSETFTISFFYCIYKMFGIAPVDAMKLKDNQITEVDNYYKIETTRSKTAIPVTIFVDKDFTEGNIITYLLQSTKDRGGYLFPILNDSYKTEGEIMLAIKHENIVLNKALRKIAIKLSMQPFTLYSARHTFASLRIQDGNSIGKVAKAMGRSIAGIDRYVQDLLTNDDLKRLTF